MYFSFSPGRGGGRAASVRAGEPGEVPVVRGARHEQVGSRDHHEQAQAGVRHLWGAHRRITRHRRHPLLPQGESLGGKVL